MCFPGCVKGPVACSYRKVTEGTVPLTQVKYTVNYVPTGPVACSHRMVTEGTVPNGTLISVSLTSNSAESPLPTPVT